jgi:hypothetical protein
LYPKFECPGIVEGSDDYKKYCKPEYFCDKSHEIKHRVVPSHVTLENWISKYDLVCADKFIISSFGMLYFAGFALGALFLPNMSDRYGRKNYYIGSLVA